MKQADLLNAVQTTIHEEDLLRRGQAVVVGVSGGPDSMALLHVLVQLSRLHEWGWELIVAHLDHRLRGQASAEDAKFVQEQARRLDLPSAVEAVDVAAEARRQGRTLEDAARACRYAFLERVCRLRNSPVVAVGHHADDNVETIVHRLARGTGLRGLGGIPIQRALRIGSEVRLVRPLLRLRRADLLAFLRQADLPFCTDATNLSGENTRSRIRTDVLPMLEQHVHPGAAEAILRLAEQARWMDAYLQETARRTLDTLVIARDDRHLALNARALLGKREIMQTEIVRQVLLDFTSDPTRGGESAAREQNIGFEHLKAVVRLAQEGHSGKRILLPGKVTATYEYGKLVFARPGDEVRETIAPQVAIPLEGRTVLPVRRLEIVSCVEGFAFSQLGELRAVRDPMQEWMDADQVHPPLVIRSRLVGDRFWPMGAPGSKKLSDFFIDRKVPPAERERAVVLCDQLGPIWVIGHRLDERVKLTRSTRRALKLRVQRLGDSADPPGSARWTGPGGRL